MEIQAQVERCSGIGLELFGFIAESRSRSPGFHILNDKRTVFIRGGRDFLIAGFDFKDLVPMRSAVKIGDHAGQADRPPCTPD